MSEEARAIDNIKPYLRLLEGSIEEARARRLRDESDDAMPDEQGELVFPGKYTESGSYRIPNDVHGRELDDSEVQIGQPKSHADHGRSFIQPGEIPPTNSIPPAAQKIVEDDESERNPDQVHPQHHQIEVTPDWDPDFDVEPRNCDDASADSAKW